jgi:hypothetical protein
MYCPRCGAANIDSSPQCVSCGAAFLLDTPAWQAARRGYADLSARYARGEVDAAAFQSAHATLAVQDAAGRYWLPGEDPDQPYLWDGAAWTPQAVVRLEQPVPSAAGAPPAYPTPVYSATYSTQQPVPVYPSTAVREAPTAGAVRRTRAAEVPPPRKRHRLRGCCLGTLLVIVVLAAAGVWVSPLPEQWGLRKSAAEKAFGANPEPDRGAALALTGAMEEAGVDTTGLSVYVLPYQDASRGTVLYAVLDGSQGFRFPEAGEQDPVLAYMAGLANSPALAEAGVNRIAIDYRDSSGAEVVVMTAPVASIQAFSRGEITREVFLQSVEAQVDLGSMVGEFMP